MAEIPELSPESVRQALAELGEFLASDSVIAAIGEAGGEDDVWNRISLLPRDYLARRDVKVPERLEVVFEGKWPGRKCFRICRSIDPIPPPPDPTGLMICVELCLPWRE
jgi:hypothetical protein